MGDLRAEIVQLTTRRQELETDLASLEEQIFRYEGTYLKESPYGNVVRGWSAYKNPNTQATYEVRNEDRLFSLSSVASARSKELLPPLPEPAESKKRKRAPKDKGKKKKARSETAAAS